MKNEEKTSEVKTLTINDASVQEGTRLEILFKQVSAYIYSARENIQRTIDTKMIQAYWLIGRDIVEEEQKGGIRAEYGRELLKALSDNLCKEFGLGFSVDTLERARKFYLIYQIDGENEKSAPLVRKSEMPSFKPNLSWTHYLALIRVKRSEARAFYEIEANNNNWSCRELRRQIGSLLFDRLAKSKDKQGLLSLAYHGQEIQNPQDAIKDPLILEFLGLPEAHQLTESKLEEALINNLQHFLLELGKGFAFIGRQRRVTLDNNHYYVDLVFYHAILKCYVIVDLKTHPITHADLGQMLFYVNYFDQEVKTESDNPTIGLVLCTEKSDKMVEYTLGEKGKQIFASAYQFHLPTEAELETELKREIKEIKHLIKIMEQEEKEIKK